MPPAIIGCGQRKKKKAKKWVSPQIKAILEKSGKDFGEVLHIEDQDDSFE